jgi:HEAT repeat protein
MPRSTTLAAWGNPPPDAYETMLAALSHCNHDVSHIAAETLPAVVHVLPSLPDAAVAAMKDKEVHVRFHAAQVLGRIGAAEPEAVSALRGGLDDDEKTVRYFSAAGLIRLNQEVAAASTVLRKILESDNRNWRWRALTALVQQRPANPQVTASLKAEFPNGDERIQALTAIVLATAAPASTAGADQVAAEKLVKALRSRRREVRLEVVLALAILAPTLPLVVVDQLVLLKRARVKSMRRLAAIALHHTGHGAKDWKSALDSLRMRDAGVRNAAISLFQQVKIEDEPLRQEVLSSLARRIDTAPPGERPSLVQCIRTITDGYPLPGYRWQAPR